MMPQPWIAEVNVTVDLARSLIESQFPALRPARVRIFGEGWDNTAYLVNENTLFRFPRRELAGPLMLSECRLLPLIASCVPLSVPAPEYVGRPADGYPWQFSGYRLLPGVTACEACLTDEERFRMAEPLARFLRSLHAIPACEARRQGAGGDTIGRLDMGKRIPLARKLLGRFRTTLDCNTARLEQMLDATPMDYARRDDTLVHGDLYCRHLLVDESHDLCGVIDWGDCHVGDRAIDLLPVYTLLPKEAREQFFAVYGRVDALTARVAQARAIYHTLNVLNYARDIADAPLEREAVTGLTHLAEC